MEAAPRGDEAREEIHAMSDARRSAVVLSLTIFLRICVAVAVGIVLLVIGLLVFLPIYSSNQEHAAAADAAWIRSNITVGLTRDAAYDRLRSRNIVAANPAFSAGKAIGFVCVDEQNGGTWPYKNEPLPRVAGPCASMQTHSDPEPHAYVELAAGTSLVCGFSRVIDFGFDSRDRVSTVKIGGVRSVCL
jgi:hypothetical protein